MLETSKTLRRWFRAHARLPEVLNPGDGALHRPTPAVTPRLKVARPQAHEHGFDRHVRSEVAGATALPYGDASFDTVFSPDTLHRVDDPVRMRGECAGVLKPGGVALNRVICRSRGLSIVEGILSTRVARDAVAELLPHASFEQFKVGSGLLHVTAETHR